MVRVCGDAGENVSPMQLSLGACTSYALSVDPLQGVGDPRPSRDVTFRVPPF